MKWLISSDEFGFQLGETKIPVTLKDGLHPPTKREFLKIIMSVFDPLGCLAPFTIRSRILMQEIWISGIPWDQALREKEFEQWKLWLSDLVKIRNIRHNIL